MALPANFNTVPVFGDYVNLDGSPVSGKITFTMTPVLTDVTSAPKVTIVPAPLTVQLNNFGHFGISVPATDDPDIIGGPFIYQVTEGWSGGRTFYFEVPLAAALTGGLDMAFVDIMVDPPADVATTYISMAAFEAAMAGISPWYLRPIYVLHAGEDESDVPLDFPANGLLFIED